MFRVPDVCGRVKMPLGTFHCGMTYVIASAPKTTYAASALIDVAFDAAGTVMSIAWAGPRTSVRVRFELGPRPVSEVRPHVAGKTSETAMSLTWGVGVSRVQAVVVPSVLRSFGVKPLSVDAWPATKSATPRHESGFR